MLPPRRNLPRPWRYDRRAFLASVGAAGLVLAGSSTVQSGGKAGCKGKLSREVLDESLSLGTRFLLANQKKAGNFQYELDWKTLKYTSGDSPVRQAGAAWGLALIHHDRRVRGQSTEGVAKALRGALEFFDDASKVVKGRRFIVYPTADFGSLGTVALVALSLIDYLRVRPSKKLRRRLGEYLAFITHSRRDGGRFHSGYRHADGKPTGAPSPYFDGEALLALTKAARYLGRSDLRDLVLEETEAGYAANVEEALADDPDSSITKGYYQWASMAYYELATWKQTKSKVHAQRLLELADWMIDVHRTLKRTRNTGYAYEGIVPAYAIAERDGLKAKAEKLRCTVERGLGKLCSWQIGNPLANRYIRSREHHDARAMGGVQNHRKEPLLRIDVTQHQMHAVILARRHLYK